jgi:hypothetical protein
MNEGERPRLWETGALRIKFEAAISGPSASTSAHRLSAALHVVQPMPACDNAGQFRRSELARLCWLFFAQAPNTRLLDPSILALLSNCEVRPVLVIGLSDN